MKQLASFTVIIAIIIFIFSCSKVKDGTPKQQQVDSVKIFGQDSTELVKSITDIWTDSTGSFQDSTISFFFMILPIEGYLLMMHPMQIQIL